MTDYSRFGAISFRQLSVIEFTFAATVTSANDRYLEHLKIIDTEGVFFTFDRGAEKSSVVNDQPLRNSKTEDALRTLLGRLLSEGWEMLPTPPGTPWYYRMFARR
jgi:hypothetical protein